MNKSLTHHNIPGTNDEALHALLTHLNLTDPDNATALEAAADAGCVTHTYVALVFGSPPETWRELAAQKPKPAPAPCCVVA